MKAVFDHLTLYVSDFKKSATFYKELISYLGGKVVSDHDDHLGLRIGGSEIWLRETEEDSKKNGFHRKNTGVNHLAFRVDSPEEVDRFNSEYLIPRGISPLYNSPALFPQYTDKYYAVYFEDPDRLKLEIAFL